MICKHLTEFKNVGLDLAPIGLAEYKGSGYLDEVGHYIDNEKEGFWTEFYCFGINSKCQDLIYKKGMVTDSSQLYDQYGRLKSIRWHDGKGNVIGGISITPDGTRYLDNLTAHPSDERASLEADCPTEYDYVIFNSWTNIIDKIVISISAFLLIVNSICFLKK